MAERQAHGFSYQKTIINKYKSYGMTDIDPYTKKELKYSDKWDAYLGYIPVQIKSKRKGSNVELADIFRQSETTEDFLLIVGFYVGTPNNIVEEHILYINGNEWHTLFDKECLEEYKQLIHTITNNSCDNALWESSITNLRNKWKKMTPYLIVPRPKRDSKNQRRIQCAINVTAFYNHFIPKYEESDFFERCDKITGPKK